MKLTIKSAAQDLFGSWEIIASVNGKEYTYTLNTYDYERAMKEHNRNNHGKMLAILKGVR